MDVVGIIPARGGSTRIPRKNLALLEGRTLVAWALDAAEASGVLSEIVLSSDDPEILAEASSRDGVRPLLRPADLATATARAFDAVMHAVLDAEERRGRPYDAVAVIQATTPFTSPADLQGTIELLERGLAPSVVTIVEATDLVHPLKLKRLEQQRLVPFLRDDELTPSHELPKLYVRNGAVYASRREVLDGGILVAPDALGYVMPAERSLDINTPLDLAFAEFLLTRQTRS